MIVALLPVAVMAAGGTFTDDDTSMFEADIEWLAATGVTRGCNPPTNDNFCPNSTVTRGQMAAFMRRFAGFLGAEDGQVAAADNADTIGGMQPGDIIRINGTMSDTYINDFTASTWTDIQSMQIEAPVSGVLHVAASVGLEDDSDLAGDAEISLRITIDGVALSDDDFAYTVELSGDPSDEPFSAIGALNGAVAVSPGMHTIALEAWEIGSGTFIKARSVSATFSAYGGGISIPVNVEPQVYNN